MRFAAFSSRRSGRFAGMVPIMLLSGDVLAQAPISIEQLLVDASRWQISSSAFFRSANPAGLRGRQSGGSTSLRYGVNSRLEINAGLQGASLSRRNGELSVDNTLQSASLGINMLVHRESRWPALLLEARAELFSRNDGQDSSLPGGQLALTAYKSLDPVVLSVTAVVERYRERASGASQLRPGSAWRLEPAVNFAVNPELTLLSGFVLARQHSTRLDGVALGLAQDEVALRLGVGYSPRREHSFFVTGDLASNRAGSVNLQWFYEF